MPFSASYLLIVGTTVVYFVPELNLATNISLIWRNQILPMVILFLFIEIKYHSIILPAVIIYYISTFCCLIV